MIPRYTRPEMARIWAPETRFRIWFEIEAHAATAMAQLAVSICFADDGCSEDRGAVRGIGFATLAMAGLTAFAAVRLHTWRGRLRRAAPWVAVAPTGVFGSF